MLAGFKNIVKSVDITEGSLVVSPNENDWRTTVFRKLLAVAPKPGTNTVSITHKPNTMVPHRGGEVSPKESYRGAVPGPPADAPATS